MYYLIAYGHDESEDTDDFVFETYFDKKTLLKDRLIELLTRKRVDGNNYYYDLHVIEGKEFMVDFKEKITRTVELLDQEIIKEVR